MPLLTITDPNAHSLSVRAKALVFEDPKSRSVLARLQQIAPSDATVLVTGETGTGKEIVARHIHELSRRSEKRFVAVNCGALTESLIESELFGHEKGAFTGAISQKVGWFEAATGGTLFLDEIGDLPSAVQVKLLRILQEGEVVRVGARDPIRVDVRLVAATNVVLEEAVAAGRFREDLYYRLTVAPLVLPPLRERPGDILPLTLYFLRFYANRLGIDDIAMSPEANQRLLEHPWPGNIRELENAIHHALLVCRNPEISPSDLRLTALPRIKAAERSSGEDSDSALARVLRELFESEVPDLWGTIERTVMTSAYDYCERNQLQTARLLGISRNVVRARLLEFGEIPSSVRPPPPDAATADPAATREPAPPPVPRVTRSARPPVRIGYQRFGLLPLVKAQGGLDAVLGARGFRVEWLEYPGGIQIVEAFQARELALGVVGEGPPAFAHAASVPIVYVASEAPAPEDEALIVPFDSPISSVRELRGKKIALNRGANVHYLLIRALEEAGLRYDEVEVVYLTPNDARAAFEIGSVDAWAIWAPMLTDQLRSGSARVLRNASGLCDNSVLYIASQPFFQQHPDVVNLFFAQLVGVAASLAPHRIPGRVDASIIAEQQAVADAFLRHKLIAREIRVGDSHWSAPAPRLPIEMRQLSSSGSLA